MPEPALLVVSVYGPSPHNDRWLALQKRWLAHTLNGHPHRFGIVLNGVEPPQESVGVEIVAALPDNLGHAVGLAKATDWLRESSEPFALILDSDAFPVKPGWFRHLVAQMKRFEKRIAAPVRFENLDHFPHPCAMLMERSVIDEPWFSLQDGIEAKNLLGDVIRDVAASMVDLHSEVLPLLRSNVVNLHPVAAALYQDCFYHHGAGSREFRFRVSDRYGYLEGWPAPLENPESLLAQLFEDADGLLGRLRGSDLARRGA